MQRKELVSRYRQSHVQQSPQIKMKPHFVTSDTEDSANFKEQSQVTGLFPSCGNHLLVVYQSCSCLCAAPKIRYCHKFRQKFGKTDMINTGEKKKKECSPWCNILVIYTQIFHIRENPHSVQSALLWTATGNQSQPSSHEQDHCSIIYWIKTEVCSISRGNCYI